MLECENNKYYVGSTTHKRRRLREYDGVGANKAHTGRGVENKESAYGGKGIMTYLARHIRAKVEVACRKK